MHPVYYASPFTSSFRKHLDQAERANIQPKPKPVADKPKQPGHGQLHASAYTVAETVVINHPEHQAGDACPTFCGGRLYEIKTPGVFIRIEGGQLFNAYRYEQQRLRCALLVLLS